MNNRRQGNDFEKLAADYLKRNGMDIIQMNFYCKMGEVDIIAKDGSYLVFVEVKYRKSAAKGSAASAVTFNKMRKIAVNIAEIQALDLMLLQLRKDV